MSAIVPPIDHQYLCYAWGETDLPEVFIASNRAEVREFILHVWHGGTECESVDEAMDEFEAHDFAEDGLIEWGFEQGAVRIERVFNRGEWQSASTHSALPIAPVVRASASEQLLADTDAPVDKLITDYEGELKAVIARAKRCQTASMVKYWNDLAAIYRTLLRGLAELQKVESGMSTTRWTPITERPPGLHDPVLLAYPRDADDFDGLTGWVNEGWRDERGYRKNGITPLGCNLKPTHWAPMPVPPAIE